MTADGSAIRGDGTQVFAIAKGGDTAGGVTFASSSDPSNASLETTPAKAGGEGWGLGVNNNIINAFWWWNMSGTSTDVTFKLKGLTSGRKYLVQIVASHFHNSSGITISAGDIAPVTANDGNDYKYGAVITRVFEAAGTTENVVVNFSGSRSRPSSSANSERAEAKAPSLAAARPAAANPAARISPASSSRRRLSRPTSCTSPTASRRRPIRTEARFPSSSSFTDTVSAASTIRSRSTR